MAGFNITEDPAPEDPSPAADAPAADAPAADAPVDDIQVDVIPVRVISPREFAQVIDEGDLITQLKDLQSQYNDLIVPDPNQESRYELALKMQAIRDRLQRI